MPQLDRRDFLKLVGAGAGAAGLAGCSEPVEKLIPYVIQPEEITPGIAVEYASTCRECPAACGLVVRTCEARPVKLEGNPRHPVNRGSLCARGQAAIGRTYHPDRHRGPLRREGGAETPLAWDGADGAVALLARRIAEARAAGQRVVVLGADRGPTANRWIDAFCAAAGAERIVHEPLGFEALREASRTVFGVASEPVFDLSGADLVLDFGSDFLETGPSPTEHARQLREARDVADPAKRAARLVYVGPRLSLTGSNADEWLPARPGSEGILALALARIVVEGLAPADPLHLQLGPLLAPWSVERAAAATGIDAAVIGRIGRALAGARAAVALPPGAALASRRAIASNAAVLILNHVVGAIGARVRFFDGGSKPHGRTHQLLALADAMRSGQVGVLLVHDVNPSYALPPAAGFADALGQVPCVVSFASAADETSARAHLVLPDHSPLESWGDAEPRPGVRSLLQPTLRPLFDTRSLVDTLLDTGRALGGETAAALPSGSFRALLEQAWSADGDFRAALVQGGRFADAPVLTPVLQPGAAQIEVAEPLLDGDGKLVLVAFPSPLLGDGRGANLPWLQEIPDPVAKVAWQSWAEISRRKAEELGVEVGDVVAVETPAGRLELSVLPRGGLRDDVVAIPMGQGHTVGHFATHACDGRPGEPRGVNVLSLLPAASDESGGPAWLAVRADVRATGSTRRLALVQTGDNKRGRQLGEVVTLAAFAAGSGNGHGAAPAPGAAGAHGEAVGHGGGGHETHEIRKPYDAAADAAPASPYRWGMTIDLDRCTGCTACVAACYVENNIPVVGEQKTLQARQMSWIRIERYVGDGEPELETGRNRPRNREELGDVDVRHSPMLCQHCGAAPCEPVCPVIATFHNAEGLNGMVYNRCVGTRYCSNNCPYKVRRFNYFDYSLEREPATGNLYRFWPEPMPEMLNPDVTVRGQGVMEKCTFCVQRIHVARQAAKDAGRPIADGEVVPACAQACPAQAITFGNLRDPASRVSQAGDDATRGYHALHVLNTRPAITYLAKVKRGPVEG
jgi:molybdopterin-containing oxidoreductase family iron-sulfur binding subunit